MNAAKSTVQRVKETNARKIKAGLKLVRSLWAFPEDIPAIRAHASRLAKRRAKTPKE